MTCRLPGCLRPPDKSATDEDQSRGTNWLAHGYALKSPGPAHLGRSRVRTIISFRSDKAKDRLVADARGLRWGSVVAGQVGQLGLGEKVQYNRWVLCHMQIPSLESSWRQSQSR